MSHHPADQDHAAWQQYIDESPALCLAYVKEHAERGSPQSVLDSIDDFCVKREMINVGPTRGAIVDEAIRKRQPRIMAELGSYSGYSTVRFASVQREVAGADAHYYAFEFNPKNAEVVREMVAFAGLADQVTVFTGAFADNIHELKGKIVDLYFIDHEKSVYLSDTQLILASGTLRRGGVLVADNVLFPGASNFLEVIKQHEQFKSALHEVAMGSDIDAVMVSEFLG